MLLGCSSGPKALLQVSALSRGTRASLTASASGPSTGKRWRGLRPSGQECRFRGGPPSPALPSLIPTPLQDQAAFCEARKSESFPSPRPSQTPSPQHPILPTHTRASPRPWPAPYLRRGPPSPRWRKPCRLGAPGAPGAGTQGARPLPSSPASTAARGPGRCGRSAGQTAEGVAAQYQ